MGLDPDYNRQAWAWFKAKCNRHCPMCGETDWRVGDLVGDTFLESPDQATVEYGKERFLVRATFLCHNCLFVAAFAWRSIATDEAPPS